MALKKGEIDAIKNQLLGQVDNFPTEKQEAIKTQIQSMSNDQVEEFVKQNELTHMPGGCIFCSIIEGKSPSVKVSENDHAIAILEINPLSKGHSLIVPKKHGEKVGVQASDMAKALSSKMKKVLGVSEVTIREIKIMDHALLEVIPVYGDEKERYQATQDELLEMQKILTGEITDEDLIEDDSNAKEIVEEVEEEMVQLSERVPRFS
jgi:predicted transcriptional regulator